MTVVAVFDLCECIFMNIPHTPCCWLMPFKVTKTDSNVMWFCYFKLLLHWTFFLKKKNYFWISFTCVLFLSFSFTMTPWWHGCMENTYDRTNKWMPSETENSIYRNGWQIAIIGLDTKNQMSMSIHIRTKSVNSTVPPFSRWFSSVCFYLFAYVLVLHTSSFNWD